MELPLERFLHLLGRDGAGPDDRPRAVLLIVAQVEDRRRRSGKLAAVDDHVDGQADELRHLLEPARVLAAGAVGARLQDGSPQAYELGQLHDRYAQPERAGVLAASQREPP